ncbi:MAG TPA: tetratricopeptide repeat protein, partial [Actinomycetota bacterium]|nr:tetratricopeptide repeat protein [Actinomycetota bacterium]
LGPIEASVAIRRALAGTDRRAFLPDLATSLNNLSVRLMELGRGDEALGPVLEAVRYHRALAQESRKAFLPDLALSLSNLSEILAELGRPEEAKAVAQEAVSLGRPDDRGPDVRGLADTRASGSGPAE